MNIVIIEHPFVGNVGSHATDAFLTFQGHLFKKLCSLFALKKQILYGRFTFCQTIQHWFDLQFAFFGRGEVAMCHFSLYLLDLIPKIHDLSPVITRVKKSCSLAILSRRLKDRCFFRLSFCPIWRFCSFLGAGLSHVQMFSQNLDEW